MSEWNDQEKEDLTGAWSEGKLMVDNVQNRLVFYK